MTQNQNRIDYDSIIKNFPWIIEKNRMAILSPDSDGLLCGLLMSSLLNWEIVGFYDAKVLAIKTGINPKNCVFLDVDIFRKDVMSIGHHMVMFRSDKLHRNWKQFDNCIQPNNIRGYNYKDNFGYKYPLATIHLMLGILEHASPGLLEINEKAICPLVYTDGTFKNLFNYPENCISWLKYLRADDDLSPLNMIFFNDHYSVYNLMEALKDFFEKIRVFNENKRGGDKITISDSSGNLKNLDKRNNSYSLNINARKKAEMFIEHLSHLTGWVYQTNNWQWNDFSVLKFTKTLCKPNNKNYTDLLNKRPLSFAITATDRIEYTLEKPDKLF